MKTQTNIHINGHDTDRLFVGEQVNGGIIVYFSGVSLFLNDMAARSLLGKLGDHLHGTDVKLEKGAILHDPISQ